VSSWTGSESQRRPQGLCLPPTTTANETPRFLIRAGTMVSVQRFNESMSWYGHMTRMDIGFERWEGREDGQFTFRHEGYFIRVPSRKVIRRSKTSRLGQTKHLSMPVRRETRPRW
jgi:hypothetical protein